MTELANSNYAALDLDQRLEVLSALVGAALEGPSLRADLESRLEECARVRRTMAEENRVSLPKGPACDQSPPSCFGDLLLPTGRLGCTSAKQYRDIAWLVQLLALACRCSAYAYKSQNLCRALHCSEATCLMACPAS